MKKELRGTLPMNLLQSGFSLLEVMVVLLILGLLAGLVAPRILNRVDDARVQKAYADMRGIETALQLYQLDNYRLPTTDQGIEALVEKPRSAPEPKNWKAGGYLDVLPIDPWGRPYLYLSPGEHGEFDLYTLGADGSPGGDGQNADLGNWQARR